MTSVGELNKNGVDIVDTVILEYEGGRRAVLNAHGKVKLWNKATVVGTESRITVSNHNFKTQIYFLIIRITCNY